jgi:hypothetical protein
MRYNEQGNYDAAMDAFRDANRAIQRYDRVIDRSMQR